ncbi:MAG: N-acetyl-alpha-D-glucosaminyl L-malate synthase [Phycisphaerae bacterium]|nr:N-acetyl-alpha-D-glucosaminyl L-malate synthase [Phycisphaerae bacterium]
MRSQIVASGSSVSGKAAGVAPIRVALVISNLEYGGAQRQVIELANHLDRGAFEVHVCSLSRYVPLAADLEDAAERLFVLTKRFKFDVSVIWRLAGWLRRIRADVVHSYLFDANIAARLAGRLAGVRAVIGSERNTDYHLKRRQIWAYRATRGCSDLILANSRAGAQFNRRMLGHPEEHYRVVHNGVDTVRFRPQAGAGIRARLGLAAEAPVVGMFASFKAQKNHPLLLEAARRVLDRRADVKFLLVGDELHGGMHGSDAYKARVFGMIESLGLSGACVLAGNRDDVEDVYCACDVTVLPSLFEGTPNVLLESMSCGVPVVATDVADNAAIAPDGRVGFIVPLGDAGALADRLLRLIEDGELRRRFGAAARAWVESEFSTARLAEKTGDVYREALALRARRGVERAQAAGSGSSDVVRR